MLNTQQNVGSVLLLPARLLDTGLSWR